MGQTHFPPINFKFIQTNKFMSKHVSDFVKGQIFAFRRLNMTYREIENITGIAKSTIQRIVKRYEETGQSGRKPGSGLSSVLSNKEKLFIENY